MEQRKPNGYWKDFGNVRKELEPIIQELGHFPTKEELEREGRSDLVNGIRNYHLSINKVKEILGHRVSRRAPNYWKDIRNIKKEIEPLIKELGHFPVFRELKEKRLLFIITPIERYHGGLSKIRELMGYNQIKKPRGYWKNFSNLEIELEPIIKELGHFPNSKELEKKRLSSLSHAITKYFGGFMITKGKMGYKSTKKYNNYWKNFEHVKRELESLIIELGHFPTGQEFIKRKKGGLLSGIYKYHNGLLVVGNKLGYHPIRKPKDYWKNFEHVKKELEPTIKELGHFPTGEELKERGFHSILSSISKYHGGFSEIRERNRYEQLRRAYRYWQNFENVKKELEPIIKELGHFPKTKELLEKNPSLSFAMIKYYEGLNRVREKMGYSVIRKRNNYWQNFENVKRELQKVIREDGHFPTKTKLAITGKSGLASAITKYHGGMIRIRKRLGYDTQRKVKDYWKDFGNVKRELEPIIKKIGHFPTKIELEENGYGNLNNGISKYHGGVTNVRKKLGYKLQFKPHNYWKDFENVRKALESIIKESGNFPSYKKLEEINHGLIGGISKYHGGLNKIREIMGYPPNGKIRTEKSLVELLDNDEKARRVVERFGGDIGDIADILAIVYEGRLSKEDAAKLVAKPSIRAYLGRFRRPIGGIGELAEISNELLPHDRNEVIQGILYRKVTEYIYQKCGPYPSKEKRQALLDEFEGELGEIGGNGNV